MDNAKYEFLYNYARAGFEDELLRFKNIEDKSTKYLSLLSIIVVTYTIVIRFYLELLLPIVTVTQALACIVISITYLALASSWSLLYRALQFTKIPRLPLDDEFIRTHEPEELSSIHFSLMKSCSKALELTRIENSKKSTLLTKGYKDIGFSMWSLTISIILIISVNLTTEGKNKMSEDEKVSQAIEQKSESPKVIPEAKLVFVMDSAEQVNKVLSKENDNKS